MTPSEGERQAAYDAWIVAREHDLAAFDIGRVRLDETDPAQVALAAIAGAGGRRPHLLGGDRISSIEIRAGSLAAAFDVARYYAVTSTRRLPRLLLLSADDLTPETIAALEESLGRDRRRHKTVVVIEAGALLSTAARHGWPPAQACFRSLVRLFAAPPAYVTLIVISASGDGRIPEPDVEIVRSFDLRISIDLPSPAMIKAQMAARLDSSRLPTGAVERVAWLVQGADLDDINILVERLAARAINEPLAWPDVMDVIEHDDKHPGRWTPGAEAIRRASVHEAGHAVVAAVLLGPRALRSAKIARWLDNPTAVIGDGLVEFEPEVGRQVDGGLTTTLRGSVIWLAGRMAETRITGSVSGACATDMSALRADIVERVANAYRNAPIVRDIDIDPAVQDRVFADAWQTTVERVYAEIRRTAAEIIEPNRAAIERLAERLGTSFELVGDELLDAIADAHVVDPLGVLLSEREYARPRFALDSLDLTGILSAVIMEAAPAVFADDRRSTMVRRFKRHEIERVGPQAA